MAKISAKVMSVILTMYAIFVLANAVLFPKHDLRSTLELYSGALAVSVIVEVIASYLYSRGQPRPKSIRSSVLTPLTAVWFSALAVYLVLVGFSVFVYGGNS